MRPPQWLDGPPLRGPGCAGCVVATVALPGRFSRVDLELHDPEAHEAHGRRMAAPDETPVLTGGLAIDVRNAVVTVDGRAVAPTLTELRLLAVLGRRCGRLASHGELCLGVWGDDGLRLPAPSYRHALRVAMSRLRRRIGPLGGLISTVPQQGYRLESLPVGAAAPLPSANHPARADGWAHDWARCRSCGLTDQPHQADGYCRSCAELRAVRSRRGSVAATHARAAQRTFSHATEDA